MYPFDRPSAFLKDIRKLGVTDAGLSFLDQPVSQDFPQGHYFW